MNIDNLNDIEKAVLLALRKVKPDADEIDVSMFITNLLKHNHIIKPLSDAEAAEIMAKIEGKF